MARKQKEVPILTEGRDKGKKFLLTEMAASRATKWAYRALGSMARAGIDIPPHILDMGMFGVVAMGLRAVLGAKFDEAEKLLDELNACIQITHFPNQQLVAARALIEDDIEEPTTWFYLQSEVFELHTGFSVAAALLKVWVEAAERVRKFEALRDTPTSQETPG